MATTKKASKKVTRKGAKGRKAGSTRAATAGTIPLKRICSDLGIEPKPARVKLRRHWRGEKGGSEKFHRLQNRWEFTPAEAKEIKAVLGG